MSYKIGYIDENPHQVRKFARALKEYDFIVIGYDIIKGMSIDDLIEQVYQSDIDLLMIDYFLKDKGILTFNGDEIERRYNEIKPNFPHIIFTSNEEYAFKDVDNPNIIYEKEMVTDDRVNRFSEILQKNIEKYRSYIENRKEVIETLLEKDKKDGLNTLEKDQLLQLQIELNNLDIKNKKEVPLQLISNQKVEDLSKTRKEAQEFLQSLIDKKE